MAKFEIKDSNTSIPMYETHYYQWLKDNKVEVHSIKTKVEYLTSQGFVVGTDIISDKDLASLKAIEQHYSKFNTIFDEMDGFGF